MWLAFFTIFSGLTRDVVYSLMSFSLLNNTLSCITPHLFLHLPVDGWVGMQTAVHDIVPVCEHGSRQEWLAQGGSSLWNMEA